MNSRDVVNSKILPESSRSISETKGQAAVQGLEQIEKAIGYDDWSYQF